MTAWRSLILLTTLLVVLAWAQPELSMEEGTPCPHMLNYPESRCMRICPIIEDYINKKQLERENIVNCNRAQGLICCPNQPLQDTSFQQGSRQPLVSLRKYRHLATLRFLRAETLDDQIHRCTAVLVRPNFVLTSALCGERPSQAEMSPNHARLGLIKPYQGSLEITYDSPGRSNYKGNNDLSLLKLRGNFSTKSVARICTQPDFDSADKLEAVGFSQLEGKICDPFKMEVSLREFSTCDVQKNYPVLDIGNLTHFCVRPIKPPKAKAGECFQCLRGSASVLHAVLPDGGLCVAGVATPTSSNCHDSGSRLYYTSLIGEEIAEFIRNAP